MEFNFSNKRGIILTVADEKSLAYSIAKKLSIVNAGMIIGYQLRNEAKINEIKDSLKNALFLRFDVADESLFEEFFKQVSERFGRIDYIVHSMAFTKKETLRGKFMEISKDNYLLANNISVFSLTQIVQKFLPILNDNSSIVALTFSEKVIPSYNIMGVCKSALNSSIRYLANDLGEKQIRVNGISSGPVATSAASAIEIFPELLETFGKKSVLKRNITPEEVANTVLFLLSEMSRGITGQIINVDAGYSIMGI